MIVVELRLRPAEETITVEGAFRAFLDGALRGTDTKRCPDCFKAASTGMRKFVQALKSQVSAQISAVSLVFLL